MLTTTCDKKDWLAGPRYSAAADDRLATLLGVSLAGRPRIALHRCARGRPTL